MGQTSYVYGLTDPFTGELCYVGKTDCLRTRVQIHLSKARTRPTLPVHIWIRSLLDVNQQPIVTILRTADSDDVQRVEIEVLNEILDQGHPLLNVNLYSRQARQRRKPVSTQRREVRYHILKSAVKKALPNTPANQVLTHRIGYGRSLGKLIELALANPEVARALYEQALHNAQTLAVDAETAEQAA